MIVWRITIDAPGEPPGYVWRHTQAFAEVERDRLVAHYRETFPRWRDRPRITIRREHVPVNGKRELAAWLTTHCTR